MPKKKIPDDAAKMAGLRLRAAREALDWPQGAFARRIGVPQNTLGNWEGGRFTMPAVYAMVKAHMLCGVPLDWVYCGSLNNFARDKADLVEQRAAELGAVIGAPVAEWPQAVERETHLQGMRKPAAAPESRKAPGRTFHERQRAPDAPPDPTGSPDTRPMRRARS